MKLIDSQYALWRCTGNSLDPSCCFHGERCVCGSTTRAEVGDIFPPAFSKSLLCDAQVHTMMEESATACVSGDFAQALEKAKEAVSQQSLSVSY